MTDMMNNLSTLTLVAALCVAPAFAQDALPPAAEEARIPFADNGGIRNWRAEPGDVLLIEARGGDWYRAEMMGPCIGLNFTETIGFETNPNGSFDRFSSVRTRDGECHVRSLTRTSDPDADEG